MSVPSSFIQPQPATQAIGDDEWVFDDGSGDAAKPLAAPMEAPPPVAVRRTVSVGAMGAAHVQPPRHSKPLPIPEESARDDDDALFDEFAGLRSVSEVKPRRFTDVQAKVQFGFVSPLANIVE